MNNFNLNGKKIYQIHIKNWINKYYKTYLLFKTKTDELFNKIQIQNTSKHSNKLKISKEKIQKYLIDRKNFINNRFILRTKEIKYEYKDWKFFFRDSIFTLCFLSNIIYIMNIKGHNKILKKSFNYFKYSMTFSLLSSYLIQKQLKKIYKEEIKILNDDKKEKNKNILNP
jgi:hypothetical protein